MPDVITDPFHRALKFALEEQITLAMGRLAAGSASLITEDRATVAEKYAAQVARIQALNDVLEMCVLIEKNMLDVGVRPNIKVVEK
jgi:hypothetical protein